MVSFFQCLPEINFILMVNCKLIKGAIQSLYYTYWLHILKCLSRYTGKHKKALTPLVLEAVVGVIWRTLVSKGP